MYILRTDVYIYIYTPAWVCTCTTRVLLTGTMSHNQPLVLKRATENHVKNQQDTQFDLPKAFNCGSYGFSSGALSSFKRASQSHTNRRLRIRHADLKAMASHGHFMSPATVCLRHENGLLVDMCPQVICVACSCRDVGHR